jgi:hypothetical protein
MMHAHLYIDTQIHAPYASAFRATLLIQWASPFVHSVADQASIKPDGCHFHSSMAFMASAMLPDMLWACIHSAHAGASEHAVRESSQPQPFLPSHQEHLSLPCGNDGYGRSIWDMGAHSVQPQHLCVRMLQYNSVHSKRHFLMSVCMSCRTLLFMAVGTILSWCSRVGIFADAVML